MRYALDGHGLDGKLVEYFAQSYDNELYLFGYIAALKDKIALLTGTLEEAKRQLADYQAACERADKAEIKLAAYQRREQAAVTDITSLSKGEYSICDMCELFGETEESTPCPVGAYHNEVECCSMCPFPDEPCDDFKYKRSLLDAAQKERELHKIMTGSDAHGDHGIVFEAPGIDPRAAVQYAVAYGMEQLQAAGENVAYGLKQDGKDICPICLGTGRLKAMQRAAYIGGGSVRANDTTDKCTACKGTGRRQDG